MEDVPRLYRAGRLPADGPQMVALAEQWMEPGNGCWKRAGTSLASCVLDGEDDKVEG